MEIKGTPLLHKRICDMNPGDQGFADSLLLCFISKEKFFVNTAVQFSENITPHCIAPIYKTQEGKLVVDLSGPIAFVPSSTPLLVSKFVVIRILEKFIRFIFGLPQNPWKGPYKTKAELFDQIKFYRRFSYQQLRDIFYSFIQTGDIASLGKLFPVMQEKAQPYFESLSVPELWDISEELIEKEDNEVLDEIGNTELFIIEELLERKEMSYFRTLSIARIEELQKEYAEVGNYEKAQVLQQLKEKKLRLRENKEKNKRKCNKKVFTKK